MLKKVSWEITSDFYIKNTITKGHNCFCSGFFFNVFYSIVDHACLKNGSMCS